MIKKPLTNRAKSLNKVERKLAAEAEARKVEEDRLAAANAKHNEMIQWFQLVDAMDKKSKPVRPPASPERLKAMAMRFHMASTSEEETEKMYIPLLLKLIDGLDHESRDVFNIMLAELQEGKDG